VKRKTVGAAWENENRGTLRRGPLRELALTALARLLREFGPAAPARPLRKPGQTALTHPLRKPGPATPGRPLLEPGPAALTRPLRKLGLTALALTLLTACGIRPTEPIPGLEAPSGPVENTSPSLYWVSDGKVIPVSRPQGSVSGYDVIALLAQGPTNAEQSRGLSTQVPVDAAPAVVDRVASGLDVTLSSDVSQLSPVAVQQIVCTLLGIQSAGTVNLRGGGHSLEARKCA
jgi:hypothetical protein